MPEDMPIVMAEAIAAAFAAAAVAMLLCGWPWRLPRPALVTVGTVVGIGIGFYAGCLLLRPFPHWPPRDDQGRLLLVLFPAVLAVEVLAAFVRRPRSLVWLLRAVVAASAARILLHDSIYLKDLSGPGTAEWTPTVQAATLACLAIALAIVWTLLEVLMVRVPGRSVPLALAITTAGAAIVVMLSGYASGGLLGLILATALAGITAGSLALPTNTDLRGLIGPAMIGLFSLLVTGHFFGELSVSHAALLFAAPLLCWVPELTPVRSTLPWLRALARVALVVVPIAVCAVQASRGAMQDSQPEASANEATSDDYANYGR